MEAGRELDALVAERIMGLQVLPEFLHAKRYPTGDPPCVDSLQDERNAYGLGKHPFFVSPDCGCEDLDKTDPFELGEDSPHPWHDMPRFHGHAALCPEFVPLYSTDIAAAWQVVERFDGRVTVSGPKAPVAGGEYQAGDKWEAEILPTAQTYFADSVFELGDTAPHAICLAALRAVGAL